ncbi:MAG: HDIG domain-containing protein [Bacteroidales bacterium]|nr:HDIG domain-containing protein [Bacteroidales bacterium]
MIALSQIKSEIKSKVPVLIPLAVLFVVLTLIFPRQAKFSYDYRKGSPWNHETLIAQFDFPILKTEEQMMEERSRSSSVSVPYYRFRQDVVDNGKKRLEQIDLGSESYLRPAIVTALESIWAAGVVTDEGVKYDGHHEDLSSAVVYVQKEKRAAKKPVAEIYKETEARSRLLSSLTPKFKGANLDSVFRVTGVYDILVPNLEYDAKTTDLVNRESESHISTTQGFVSAGQLIVSEGEIVTSEVEQILDSYKKEFENNMGYGGPKFVFWLGNALLAFVMVFLFAIVIFFLNRKIFKNPGKFLYLIFILLLTASVTLMLNKLAPKLLYMAPLTLTALYLEAFFRNKIIMPVCCVAFLPLLVFSSNGVVLFVMFMVASQVAVLSFKYCDRGWKQFVTAGLVFASLAVTYFAFRLVDMVQDNPYFVLMLLAGGSFLSIAFYTLIYLFERMFNLLSNWRLNELCDTDNPLMRELQAKAPGTYQHSLQVMNMVDVAARSIDANVTLVRAGALYHDLGKMENPMCFVENESMSDGASHYHSNLTLKESAAAITSHVTDGVRIATQHGLPSVIKDFILTHHGTSYTGYFYNKYLNEGGDPGQVSEFFYKGVRPQTKEQVILMICDTLEAASRTLSDKSPESFSNLVEKLVSSKMQAGQFDDSDVTLRDLQKIKKAVKGSLSQVFHDRIEYPAQNKNNNSKQ